MAYANGKITAPVNIYDVQRALGLSSNDVNTLCKASNLNVWARWKPIRIPYSSPLPSNKPGVLTVQERKQWNWGTKVTYAFDGSTFNDLDAWINGLLGNKTMAQVLATEWVSLLTLPNEMYGRLQDYAAANGENNIISGHGYIINATPQTLVVHNGNNTLTMGSPIFPLGQRSVEIAAGEECKKEVPSDLNFVDAWAQALDLSEGGHTTDTYYTDVLTDCGDSLSSMEILESDNGTQQLVKDGRVNCQRGVAICKYDSGTWRIVTAIIRNQLLGVSGGAISTQEDNLYYNNFTLESIGSTSSTSHAYAVRGTGTQTTSAPSDSEIERLARWLCFGQYSSSNTRGGTGTQPSWYVGALYASITGTMADDLLERAKTAFYMAARQNTSYNQAGKYLDLTRNGLTTGGNMTPPGNYMYTYVGGSYTNPTTEGDFLTGDLLVVEFYKRYAEISGSTAVSPFVLIPGYIYAINITRPSQSSGTIDITDSIIWQQVVIDSSQDAFVYVLLNMSTSATPANAKTMVDAAYTSLNVILDSTTYPILSLSSDYYEYLNDVTQDGITYRQFSIGLDNIGSVAVGSATVSGQKTGGTGNPSKSVTIDDQRSSEPEPSQDTPDIENVIYFGDLEVVYNRSTSKYVCYQAVYLVASSDPGDSAAMNIIRNTANYTTLTELIEKTTSPTYTHNINLISRSSNLFTKIGRVSSGDWAGYWKYRITMVQKDTMPTACTITARKAGASADVTMTPTITQLSS